MTLGLNLDLELGLKVFSIALIVGSIAFFLIRWIMGVEK
jgi:hypothetical protein